MSESVDKAWTPMIYNKAMIANNLSALSKNKCMLTVSLGGKDTILTALINVDIKTNSIVFDTSSSEHLNSKLLTLRLVKFSTVFNGIQVSFTGRSVKKGKISGYDAFVMPFPEALYWLDRRASFRVTAPKTLHPSFISIIITPPEETSRSEYKTYYERATNKIRHQLQKKIEAEQIENRAKFEKEYIHLAPDEKHKAKAEHDRHEAELKENPPVPDENLVNVMPLQLFDISITGCSAINYDEDFSYFLNVKSHYKKSVLIMPEHISVEVTLEIMSKRKVEPEIELEPESGHRKHEFEEFIGFRFVEPKQSAESEIFLYIQELDRLHKNKTAP